LGEIYIFIKFNESYRHEKEKTMNRKIGPYKKQEIILCSADAGPRSQKEISDCAEYFFPRAKWVGAVRNAAERLECRFVILTTTHGMVNPTDIVAPYDQHIHYYEKEVTEIWQKTIPSILGNHKDTKRIMVFYAGGVPRDPYIKVLPPILKNLNCDIISFGRPNMYDSDKIDKIVNLLINGTEEQAMRSILKIPERFLFIPA
jgi:hypothetical protein